MKARYWKILVSILFGIAVFLFWNRLCPYALSYQEQYQMFLTDRRYFLNFLPVPGGFTDYIAEFLTQFFVSFWIGAFIMASILLLLQVGVWKTARCYGAPGSMYPFSFLPSLFCWAMMMDENVMLAFPLSLALLMLCCWFSLCRQLPRLIMAVLLLIGTPFLFWTLGPLGLFYPVVVILCRKKCTLNTWISLLFAIYSVNILVCSQYLVNYSLPHLANGITYYRFPEYNATFQWTTTLLTVFIPCLRMEKTPAWIATGSGTLITFVITIAGLLVCYDAGKYDLLEYDGLVRGHQWNKILQKAQKKQPSQPMSVCAVNLALAMKNQLSDNLFEFFQNGAEGLFPAFQRDFTTPVMTGEVYYQLGFINTAQRYVFEAQEAIPNYKKSSRLTRRLAETNLINGQYDVAKKYLHRLQKTTMYGKWATETLQLIQDENAVNQHPIYGRLRKLRLTEDFLFSDQEHDQMLGLLFTHNPENRMALEYLLCYTLLEGELEKFQAYYPLGKEAGYDHIPRAYQEALVYLWTQSHPSFQGMPWSISKQTQQEMSAFAKMYIQDKQHPGLSEGRLGSSFWHYYLLRPVVP